MKRCRGISTVVKEGFPDALQHVRSAARLYWMAGTQRSSSMEYRLITLWHIAAPRRAVYDAVFDSLHWPAWWPGVEHVEQLDPGDEAGIGNRRRYTWKGRLPYRLTFVALATQIDAPRVLEAAVEGDLAGLGRWTFSHAAGITAVRYEWQVRTTRPWMNALAPLTRSIFVKNHHATMRDGGESLARRLDARLVDAYYGELDVHGQLSGS